MEVNRSSEFEYPVNELIRLRRSRRAYTSRSIEEEKIKSLFEAARWAPSSMNEQPWKYIYATKENPDLWNKIFESLTEGNRIWVKGAPLLIVSMSRKNFTKNEMPNKSARYDMGAANAFLSLQATDLGLNVHQMGGFDPSVLKSNLNVPDEYELGVVIAVGYLGDAEQLPENLKQREEGPRFRFVQEQFVMNSPF